MATVWRTLASQALKEGYQQGNPWERQLSKHLRRLFPALVLELNSTNDLKPYLIVKTSQALDLLETLESQGADPETAKELALDELLMKTPDDQERPDLSGAESQEDDIQNAVARHLLLKQP